MDQSGGKNIERSITFVAPNKVNYDAIEQIAVQAKQRGYDVEITEELDSDTEIGVYTHHRHYSDDINEKLSVIMFHGVDQGYKPHFWPRKGWEKFDIGLVTGDYSANNWQKRSVLPEYNPKIGVFNVGWPKSDYIYSSEFKKEAEELKANLDLSDGRTVIYAPTSEDHGKIHDFINKASGQADNLLIKYAPYETGEYIDRGSLNEIYKQYELEDNIQFIDKNENIFTCLYVSDVLVSDESSVLQESILTNTVPVSVVDWPIRNNLNPNFTQIPDFAIEAKAGNLDEVLSEIFSQGNDPEEKVNNIKNNHFNNLGNSSNVVMDLIESFVDSNNDSPVTPLQPNTNKILYMRYKVTEMTPESIRNYLQGSVFDRTLQRIDSKLR